MTLFRLLPAVAVATALMLPGAAAAHARLVSSTPAAGSTVASPLAFILSATPYGQLLAGKLAAFAA
jgi:methionine-rich copper-binding protein CopC